MKIKNLKLVFNKKTLIISQGFFIDNLNNHLKSI